MCDSIINSTRVALGYLRRVAILISMAGATFICARTSPASDIKTTTLHFVEPAPDSQFKEAISSIFAKAHFLRFKYSPAGTAEGSVDKDNIKTNWSFSVTQNCGGRCSMTTSKVGSRILTARRVDKKCPAPYEAALELLDSNANVLDTLSFSSGGVCFYFRGSFYGVAESNEIGVALATVPFEDIFLIQ